MECVEVGGWIVGVVWVGGGEVGEGGRWGGSGGVACVVGGWVEG